MKEVLSLARTGNRVVVVYVQAEDNQNKGNKGKDNKGKEKKNSWKML